MKEDGGFPLPLLLQLGVALLLAAALLGSLALLVSRVHWRPHPQGTCSAFACLCARNYCNTSICFDFMWTIWHVRKMVHTNTHIMIDWTIIMK